jgi:hypothetical protein
VKKEKYDNFDPPENVTWPNCWPKQNEVIIKKGMDKTNLLI